MCLCVSERGRAIEAKKAIGLGLQRPGPRNRSLRARERGESVWQEREREGGGRERGRNSQVRAS